MFIDMLRRLTNCRIIIIIIIVAGDLKLQRSVFRHITTIPTYHLTSQHFLFQPIFQQSVMTRDIVSIIALI